MMKQVNRITFWFCKFCSNLKISWMKHLPRYQKKTDAEILEFDDIVEDSEELQQLAKDLEAEYEEYVSSEPVLVPQTTILFTSGQHSHRCNFLTARRYRTYIRRSCTWAQEHGITTFIVDYTTPFGLLALEILLELRNAGANFALYTISSRHTCQRKSYRLIQETDIEIAWNLAKCDYRYQCLYSVDTVHRVYSNAGTRCTEDGIRYKRQMPNSCSDRGG